MGLPDGWNDYARIGKQIHGTRFVAFKVPLKEATNKGSQVPEDKQLYPKLLLNLIPNLGLVVDLTNTKKYYHPDEFEKLGVAYQKIQVEGHVVPKNLYSKIFRDTVNAFLEENADNDKLIGVHCTHGLNRSGFIVCRYMIEEMKMPPLEAIAAFEVARGHKMERENYIEKLKNLSFNDHDGGDIPAKIPKKEKLPSLAIDTEVDKGSQTMRGYWIDEQQLPAHHRSFGQRALDTSDHAKKQVSLTGCVDIRRRDLIPDGRGGYFVHITSKEIDRIPRRFDGPQNQQQRGPPQRYENNHRGLAGAAGNTRSNRSNPMGRSRPHQPNRPYHSGNPNRFGDHSRGMMPPMQLPPFNQLPIGGNNMAEELLRMQQPPMPPQHQQNWRNNNFLPYQ